MVMIIIISSSAGNLLHATSAPKLLVAIMIPAVFLEDFSALLASWLQLLPF